MTVSWRTDRTLLRAGPVEITIQDVALAVAVLALGVLDALYLDTFRAEELLVRRLVGAVVIALALLVRRRQALVTMVGVQLGLPFWAMTSGEPWSMTQVVAFMLGSYAVGAHLAPIRAVAAHGVVVATYVVTATIQVGNLWDGVGSVGIATFAWAVGLVVHRRAQERDELAETARLLASERDLRARAAVAEERTRIARELHDNLGHEVSVMVLHAGAVRRLLTEDQVQQRDALLEVERLGRHTVGELHRMVATLREGERDASVTAPTAPGPGLSVLPETVQRLRDVGARVRLDLQGSLTLPPAVDAAVYRVVQESLTNAIRHAPGAPVHVRICRRPDGVEVAVTDSGAGVPAQRTDLVGGWGLAGMRERVQLLGGRMAAGPRADTSGWQVSVRLPVEG